MWAIGCIYAELLGMMKEHVENYADRKPFFPGQSCFPLSPVKKRQNGEGRGASFPTEATDQLYIIFDIIGTPEPRDLCHITDKRVLYYLSTFSKKSKRDLTANFPAAGAEALDLLSKLLTFSPNNRITCEDALKHSFFDKVRHFGDSSASPLTSEVAQGGFFKKAIPVSYQHFFSTSIPVDLLEFERGTNTLNKARLRELILQEVSHYHGGVVASSIARRGSKRRIGSIPPTATSVTFPKLQ